VKFLLFPIGFIATLLAVGFFGMQVDKARARMSNSPLIDELEARMVVTLRLELSQERAKRIYPDLLDPESQLARRMEIIYLQWQAIEDERLHSPDMPFLLAREAHQSL
jgi:hypothetical protein